MASAPWCVCLCVSALCLRICLETPPHFHQDNRRLAHLAFSVPPSQYKSCRNINLLPIDYAFRPHLRGSTSPAPINVDRNPWSSGEEAFHPFIVTYVSIRTSDIPAYLSTHLADLQNALPLTLSVNPRLRCLV